MNTLRKLGKGLGLGLLAVIGLALLAYAYISHDINQRTQQTYAFARENLTIPGDSASLQRGEHLATIKGCFECHGTNLAGKIMADDPALGRLVATNLTRGQGGLPDEYKQPTGSPHFGIVWIETAGRCCSCPRTKRRCSPNRICRR